MSAREIAERVLDPELPVLTLADLGVLRRVEEDPDGRVVVTITPTYSGCPALDEMKADLRVKLTEAGYREVEVRTALSPAWTTDWISADGRRKLAEHGIAPPQRKAGPVPLDLAPPGLSGVAGSVETGGWRPTDGSQETAAHARREAQPAPPLNLSPPSQRVPCPRCGSANTTELSRFSSTACKALRRCEACREPFEHVKEI